jgi:hypothetical protein
VSVLAQTHETSILLFHARCLLVARHPSTRVQNRISDFHTELEIIPLENRSRLYIKQPVALEEYLMEGNYSKVLNAQKDSSELSAMEHWGYFMNILVQTVRTERADCIEGSYKELTKADAVQLLGMSSDKELEAFAEEVSCTTLISCLSCLMPVTLAISLNTASFPSLCLCVAVFVCVA